MSDFYAGSAEMSNRSQVKAVIPMYDELIERLRNCLTEVNCTGCDCNNSLMKQAADAIDDLENRLNLWRQDKIRRWIPVTERLPEEDTNCLIFIVSGEFSQLSWMSMAIFYNGVFHYDDHCGEFDQITHWMPLPKAPESDGES